MIGRRRHSTNLYREESTPLLMIHEDLPALASTKVVLASVKRLDDDREGAARELDDAIGDLRKVFSDSPSVPGVATALAAALNNRALHAKQDGDPEEEKARPLVRRSAAATRGVLGEQHPLVIQTATTSRRHLDARGDDDDAYEVRQDILRRLDVDEGEADASFAAAAAAAYADSWSPPKWGGL